MKRFFLIGLALLLMMSSLGHVLAAAFCPLGLGRECCFPKSPNHAHNSPYAHQDMAEHGMAMDAMAMKDMGTEDTSMDHMAMDHMAMDNAATDDSATVDMSTPSSSTVAYDEALANKFDQPVESCPHCLSHSGIANAPVSFVSASDQSGREIGAVVLPVSSLHVRPAIALAQVGLPREHAPPGMSVPRHILVSVFLI